MYLEDGGPGYLAKEYNTLCASLYYRKEAIYKEHWRERTIRNVPFEYKDCRLEIIRGAGLNSCFF